MTYEEAMDRAKALQDRLFDSCNSNSKRPNNKAIILFDEEPDICKSCEHEEGCHP